MEQQYYSVTEVAKILGIGRSKAYELVASGEIPSIRFGERLLRVPLDGLNKWLKEQEVKKGYGS